MDDIKFKAGIDIISKEFKEQNGKEWRLVAYKVFSPEESIRYHFYNIPVPNPSQENFLLEKGILFDFYEFKANEIVDEELKSKFINFINTIKE